MLSDISSLRSVVYVSVAVRPLLANELASLLVEARDLNLQSGITGVLLHSGGNFIQCFEGPPHEVEDTYDRIRASKRHKNIFELVDEPIGWRNFPDWQMGAARASEAGLLALSTATWAKRASVAPPDSQLCAGMILLTNFWRRAMRQQASPRGNPGP